LGAGHVARFGANPALLVKLLDAGERLPVHHHPDGAFAREHLGLAFGKTEAWLVIAARPGALVHVGWREDVGEQTLAAWVGEQDHEALLGALNPLEVSAGDAIFVPAGVAHAIGDGILIAELQEPTDLSILLEWDGFGIENEAQATLGLGWERALSSVERSARDAEPLRGPKPSGTHDELLPAAAAPFFKAQRIAPAAGSARLPAGFAVVIVVDGAGTLAGLDVTRGDALLVPHAAGPIDADGDLVAIACRPPGVPSP
jgi:mannose-6-phosphate isomerase